MAKVKKSNKILTVPAEKVANYLKEGYDEIDANGKVKKRATGGFVIHPPKYNKVVEELETLKAENAKLKKEIAKKEPKK